MLKRIVAILSIACLLHGDALAKSYSSGSKSSSSSSKSSSSGSKSYSSGSKSSGSSSKSYSSGSKSYSSKPSSSSYASSSKGYSAPSGKTYSAGSSSKSSSYSFNQTKKPSAPTSSSGYSFDSGAARANKEVASQRDYQKSREVSLPRQTTEVRTPSSSSYGGSSGSYGSRPATRTTVTRTYVHYYPVNDYVYRTHTTRYNTFYGGYVSRPVVYYNDPISNAFWWWLLDQSVEERALWAYHNQQRVDAERYQALLNSDAAIRGRLAELEAQQAVRNLNYVPAALAQNPDLMLSDTYINNTYASRPTPAGKVVFWVFAVPLAILMVVGSFWLLFVKRW